MASYPLLANKETTTRDVHLDVIRADLWWCPTPPTVSGTVYFNFPGQQWQALSSSSLLQSSFSSTILTCLSIQVLSRLLFLSCFCTLVVGFPVMAQKGPRIPTVRVKDEPLEHIQRRKKVRELERKVDKTELLQYSEKDLDKISIRVYPMTMGQHKEPTFQPCFFTPYKGNLNAEPFMRNTRLKGGNGTLIKKIIQAHHWIGQLKHLDISMATFQSMNVKPKEMGLETYHLST